jgi:hypothetical protein
MCILYIRKRLSVLLLIGSLVSIIVGNVREKWISSHSLTWLDFLDIGLLFLGSILLLLGVWSKTREIKGEYKEKAEESIRELRPYKDMYENLIRDLLLNQVKTMSEELCFGENERICIYFYSKDRREFECIARYSENHVYNQYSGVRKFYPVNLGIIGHVWNKGEHGGWLMDKNIPDCSEAKEYCWEYLEKRYGIEEDTAKKFRMNPLGIAAKVIKGTKNKGLAVITFESRRRDFLDEKRIKSVYANEHESLSLTLTNFVKSTQDT